MESKVFLSTDFEGINAIPNLLYDDYGDGHLYYYDFGAAMIGCVTHKEIERAVKTPTPLSQAIKSNFIASDIEFTDNPKKRVNLTTDWQFPAEVFNEVEFLALLDQDYLFLGKMKLPSGYQMKVKYNIDTTNEDPAKAPDLTIYEKLTNRYLADYTIYGIKNCKLTVFKADWFQKRALEIVEERMDKFIKISMAM